MGSRVAAETAIFSVPGRADVDRRWTMGTLVLCLPWTLEVTEGKSGPPLGFSFPLCKRRVLAPGTHLFSSQSWS